MNVPAEIALDLIYNNTPVAKEPWPLGVYVGWIAEMVGININTPDGLGAFRDWIHSLENGSSAFGLIGDPNLESVLADIIDFRELILPY
jgi:hypothetical protein